MQHYKRKFLLFGMIVVITIVATPILREYRLFYRETQGQELSYSSALTVFITHSPDQQDQNLQLGTFPLITVTPSPTPIPTAIPTLTPTPTIPSSRSGNIPANQLPSGSIPVTTRAIGGPVPPANFYCIDDVDPDMCDDSTAHLVPKGAGGSGGACGTIIEQVHRLVPALPQYMKGLRNALETAVSTTCATTGPWNAPNYVSTFFAIDAFNLAGFQELDKRNPEHVNPAGLYNWWQTPPAGYEFIPYSPQVVQQFAARTKDLTGCVMFLQVGANYHVGIVNAFELYSSNGDGVISILQAGTKMYIDRFPVSGWNIANDSTNQTSTQGVAGFGCHT
jgi:hypothetical protein